MQSSPHQYLMMVFHAASWMHMRDIVIVMINMTSLAAEYLGPLLLTWFNFNPSMDK